jgi:rhodanese-related sulfurtransferase
VEQLEILESPDVRFADAVRQAVNDWTFHPIAIQGQPGGIRVRGKLTFYFRHRANKGTVLMPQELQDELKSGTKIATDNKRPFETPSSISESALAKLFENGDVIVLDVRDRTSYRWDHRKGAINIPLEELESRARIELLPTRLIIVECAQLAQSLCGSALNRLRNMGFSRVTLLEGTRPPQGNSIR